jgi:hypothetical protein
VPPISIVHAADKGRYIEGLICFRDARTELNSFVCVRSRPSGVRHVCVDTTVECGVLKLASKRPVLAWRNAQ